LLTDIELIRKIEFFEALEPKVLKQIAEMCIVREFASGEHIVRQGEAGLGLYFITTGRAKVEIDRNDVKVVVAELKEGDSLGEFSIIDEKARSANVICVEETRCLLLTRDSFQKVMKKHPEIANQMLRTLVGRIRTVNERISTGPTAGAAAAAKNSPPVPTATAAATMSDPTAATDAPAANSDGLFERISGYLPPLPNLSDIPHPSEVFKLYTTTKTKTREYLNEMIGAIYAMKAMMRFSIAVVGCPVRVQTVPTAEEVISTEFDGVKLVLFPSALRTSIQIDAYDNGELHATFFCPRSDGPGAEVTSIQGPVVRDESYLLLTHCDGHAQLAVGSATPESWEIVRSRIDWRTFPE
jgi:CRP/FNR family transcriptional regulator, cyclic AMP receptor protein